jgi:hypothetical protein
MAKDLCGFKTFCQQSFPRPVSTHGHTILVHQAKNFRMNSCIVTALRFCKTWLVKGKTLGYVVLSDDISHDCQTGQLDNIKCTDSRCSNNFRCAQLGWIDCKECKSQNWSSSRSKLTKRRSCCSQRILKTSILEMLKRRKIRRRLQ